MKISAAFCCPTTSQQFSTSGSMRKFLLLLSCLEAICSRVGISQGYDRAFIQTNSELRYIFEEASAEAKSDIILINQVLPHVPSSSQYHDEKENRISVLGSPIGFEPPELNFKDQPLGLLAVRKVVVVNLNSESSIQMHSISGNSIHFHCSFFTKKVIRPSGNTSFEVVFLGREEGLVKNTLYVHTSAGSFRFLVRAAGKPNPYRLKPLVGVRMPLNSSYSPMIELHNPHPIPIQVLEIYSSGRDLHLELPDGETEGPQMLWQIPPYETKYVMKANFMARDESNYTAYIRIKTNVTGAAVLYLPVEVEVSSQPGIYCPQESLDFGFVSPNAPSRTLQLLILNSGQKAVLVQNVVTSPATEAVDINFQPFKIPPATLRPTAIAQITFNPAALKNVGNGLYTGKIVIKSKNNQLTLPYRANVLTGNLKVDDAVTRFHLGDEAPISRKFTATNTFKVAVAIHGITLAPDAEQFFLFNYFKKDILLPGETKLLVTLSLKDDVAWRTLDSHMIVHTNISDIRIPLVCFHGHLDKFFPRSLKRDIMDFGTLGMGARGDMYFALINRNPVTIKVFNWGANMTGAVVELLGVEFGNETHIMRRGNFLGLVRKLKILPGQYMIFRIMISTPLEEGETNASVSVETTYNSVSVPFRFRVTEGSLQSVPQDLVFDSAFPSKKVQLKLEVYSKFKEDMITESVQVFPSDRRFHVDHDNSIIVASNKSLLGNVFFYPDAECREDNTCYTGFSIDNAGDGRKWYKGMSLSSDIGDTDVAIAHSLYNRFLLSTSTFNVTLSIDTNRLRSFLFTARAQLIWPRVTKNEAVFFPLTQVDNSSIKEVVLINPSDCDLLFHLVPLAVYPDGEKVLQLLPDWTRHHLIGIPPLNSTEAVTKVPWSFRILSVRDDDDNDDDDVAKGDGNGKPLTGLADEVRDKLGVTLHKDTKAFILPARRRAKAKIKFQPNTVGNFHQGMFVRNNLTGIELISFLGESVMGQFQFGKFKHFTAKESSEPPILEFDMKGKLLKDCDRTQHSRFSAPMLTVKRSFRAKNTGKSILHFTGFTIEGSPCEGHGFKVINCEPFSLASLETKEIVIAFTPDFTMSRVSRLLTLRTSLSSDHRRFVNYTLVATIPPHMLAVCGAALPRPFWEIYLYWFINIIMSLAILCVFFAAFLESSRILDISPESCPPSVILRQVSGGYQAPPVGQVFDLKNVVDRREDHELVQPNHRKLSRRLSDAELRKRHVSGRKKLSPVENVTKIESRSNYPDDESPLNIITERPETNSNLFSTILTGFSGLAMYLGSFIRRKSGSMLSVTISGEEESNKVAVPSPVGGDLKSGASANHRFQESRQQCGGQKTKKNRNSHSISSTTTNGVVYNNPSNNSGQKQRLSSKLSASSSSHPSSSSHVDELETSSTTTESSNIDEMTVEKTPTFTSSSSGKKKKKKQKQNRQGSPCPLQSTETQSTMAKKGSLKNSTPKQECPQKVSTGSEFKLLLQHVDKKKPSKAASPQPAGSKKSSSCNKQHLVKTKSLDGCESPEVIKSSGVIDKVTTKLPRSSDSGIEPPTISSNNSSHNNLFFPSQPSAPLGGNTTSVWCQSKVKKVPPVGKILPEIKKPENKFGPIGAKPPPSSTQKLLASPWNTPPPLYVSPVRRMGGVPQDLGGNHFCLRGSQQMPPGFGRGSPKSAFESSGGVSGSYIGGGLFSGTSIVPEFVPGTGELSPSHSLMKGLLLKRRQMTEEYFANKHKSEAWPGFETTTTSPSLANNANEYLHNLWDKPPTPEERRDSGSSFEQLGSREQAHFAPSSTPQDGWGSFQQVWPTSNSAYSHSLDDCMRGQGRTGNISTYGDNNLTLATSADIGPSNLGLHNSHLSSIWCAPQRTVDATSVLQVGSSQQQDSFSHDSSSSSSCCSNSKTSPPSWGNASYQQRM